MIRVQTADGPIDIDATPEDVTTTTGHLKVTRDGTTIARFRDWNHWHELQEENPDD